MTPPTYLRDSMKIGLVLQFATLFSVLIGGLGLAVALSIHREQVKTQVFLALSARYDALLQSSSPGVWLNMRPGTILPDRTEETTIAALRFFGLLSVAYILFREGGIPRRMWRLMLDSVEPRLQNPLLVREWEHLKCEFEEFPEFVALITSIQHTKRNEGNSLRGYPTRKKAHSGLRLS